MKRLRWIGIVVIAVLASMVLFSCASGSPATPAEEAPAQTENTGSAEEPAAEEAEEYPQATMLPNTPTAVATQEVIQPTEVHPTASPQPVIPVIEHHLVELEWPSTMKYGESDVIRLSLVPDEEGYQVTAEFADHSTQTQSITVERTPGYQLYGIARLDGIGFDLSPTVDQKYLLPEGEVVHWRWSISPQSIGQQRISISLVFRWEPQASTNGVVRETLAFSKALDIQVKSFFGMKQSSAISISFMGFFAGSIMTLSGLVLQTNQRKRKAVIEELKPNPDLDIEMHENIDLAEGDRQLFMALFNRHQRVIIENQFLSGYSGARTFLIRPILVDGKQEAQTIVKISSRLNVLKEFDNYEQFVKDRLPPITARIQRNPISVAKSGLAALQYTFLAEPGQSPLSLRNALLKNPQILLFDQLFENFASHWWLQRSPYTFKLMQEYDAILPPHLILEPVEAKSETVVNLEPFTSTDSLPIKVGDIVKVNSFDDCEIRADGKSYALHGAPVAGKAKLRIRWLGTTPPNGDKAKVVHTRENYLREKTADFSLLGLPDPITSLDDVLERSLHGTKSIIHGDLNLENILVGPGSLVWLIDFAQTGEGHALKDFAHLYMEVIAHVISVQNISVEAFLDMLQNQSNPLLLKIESLAKRCQLDSEQQIEFNLAAGITCLGALKFDTVTDQARQYLYIAAAYLLSR